MFNKQKNKADASPLGPICGEWGDDPIGKTLPPQQVKPYRAAVVASLKEVLK